MSVEEILSRCGGVAHRSVILEAGASSYELGRAVHIGSIFRVRQAWYALPEAPYTVVRAVRVGGALTAVSAAVHRGLWAMDDGKLHVSLLHNGGRLRSPQSSKLRFEPNRDANVCLHWRRYPGAEVTTVEPLSLALLQSLECQPDELAIATIDSALNKRLVRISELRRASTAFSPRYGHAVEKADPESQSGTESVVRLRLRAKGVRIVSQVARPEVGRVDFLIGDRLVLECDSVSHHTGEENYRKDRDRDLALVDNDDLVIRLTYEHVFGEWHRVEPIILRQIRRGRHLKP